ncbi:RagB/SusD family nutrient uptake outer membrane protein [Maribacter sp. ANRC-HE7]|uniref:RagB/SusD family nutrient uptake outer membrane protein n=1 Tax=Maribacter aquimaris TaxID=2737171 RepID=A0ABR7V6F8_9FLAO|nr:RagB/SusD family nutrient uptake outer membrane protein [Maribacter aquimaris]MBD0780037.1 RagB/SusD family nutrient uptake outer membrane protein [Maribacter aquimaris]
MKNIVLGLIIIICFSACEKTLEEVPKDFISKANFYNNEEDAQAAIVGVYAGLQSDFFGINSYLMTELHGDFIFGRGSQAPITIWDQILDQTSIGRCATNWSSFYTTINRANAVLDNVPNIENMDTGVKEQILAEAHFLRALSYFELVRGWGAVPIKTSESIDLSAVEAPRKPESEVYELIIADALAAESGLGEVGGQTGRASKWAAKMLLAHVYLTLEEWEAAAEKAEDVIVNGPFSLVTVENSDDFYNIFAVNTSTEDIMSIHHSETKTSSIPTYIHRAQAIPYNYSSTGYYAWLPDSNSFIGDSWDDNDLRKGFNLYTQYQDSEGLWVPLPETLPVLFKKFITNASGQSVNSVPVYRLAEAYLFYAEAASNANGSPTALALERLNIIKRRAYGFDLNTTSVEDYSSGMGADDFRNAVLQERAYEFLLERRRWFDLKRTGTVQEAFAAAGKNIIDERLLWPIPEDEINNNPAISQSDQNPGY